MHPLLSRPTLSLFSAALVLTFQVLTFQASSAFAFDSQKFIDSYKKRLSTQGLSLSYGSLETVGDDSLILKDAALTFSSGIPLKTETIEFSGIEEKENNGFTIVAIKTNQMQFESPQATVHFNSSLFKNVILAGDGEKDTFKKVFHYEAFEIGAGEIKRGEETIASMSGANITVSPVNNKAPVEMKAHVSDIMIDTSSLPNPNLHQLLDDLKYDKKFTGNIAMQGTWALDTGRLNITQYDFNIDNVGTLSMPLSFSGYTLDKALEQQELQKEISILAQQKDVDKEKLLAAQTTVWETYRNIELEKVELSFKDDTLTTRSLTAAAQRSNQPREQLIAGAPIFISIGLAQLQMPQFTEMVADAVRAFLNNPNIIAISAQPETPVTLLDAYKASKIDPKSLIKLLNIQVKAK